MLSEEGAAGACVEAEGAGKCGGEDGGATEKVRRGIDLCPYIPLSELEAARSINIDESSSSHPIP